MNEQKRIVAVAGNIGSGKTRVTNLLAAFMEYHRLVEHVDDNPFLSLFYQDQARWSFDLQHFFLHSRFMMHMQAYAGVESCVLDRTIYEDRWIFAQQQMNSKLWTPSQEERYLRLYEDSSVDLGHPDLLLYLRTQVPTLRERIARRGRPYEQGLMDSRDTYLPSLQELYEDWFERYDHSKKIVIETDDLNFVQNAYHFAQLMQQVQEALGIDPR